MSNLPRHAQIRKINMTNFCHMQTPVRDLQFDLIGSVFERRNMAAREQAVTHLPDGEGRRNRQPAGESGRRGKEDPKSLYGKGED
jgi:hypothetical protein